MYIYVVLDGSEANDYTILMITRNLKTAASIYFNERQKVNGARPYVYRYRLGFYQDMKVIGDDELRKHFPESFNIKRPDDIGEWQ